MNSNKSINVLDHLLLVSLDISIWSARKKLTRQDLRLPDGSMPPEEDVITLGSKRIADPDKINELETVRRATHNACAKVGIQFLGGYGTSDEKIAALVEEIEENKKKFLTLRQALLDNYDEVTMGWIQKHPDWEHALRNAITPKSVVAERTGFDFTVYKVGTPENVTTSSTISQKADGLGGQLLREIAQEAKDLIERSILTRDDGAITRRAVGAIMRLRDKMDGLSFLASWITPLIEEIDRIVGRLPKNGNVEGDDYRHLLSMVMTLSDPKLARSLGEGMGSREDFFPALLTGTAKIEPVEPPDQIQSVDLFPVDSVPDETQDQIDLSARDTQTKAEEPAPVAAQQAELSDSDYNY